MQKLTILTFILINLIFLWTGCEKAPTTTQNNGACSTITDSRDGETYSVVKIGDQCWMAENLRYNASNSWLNTNNSSTVYGRLYDWTTVMAGSGASSLSPSGVQGICPNGWHVPSDAEWNTLELALGMSASDATTIGYRGTYGTEMKSMSNWINNGNGTNSSGLNMFPSGSYESGNFYGLGEEALFWSSTEKSSTDVWGRALHFGSDAIIRGDSYFKAHGNSCRCVKD